MNRKRGRRGRSGLLPEAAVPTRAVPRRLRVERDLFQRLTLALRGLRDPRVRGAIVSKILLTGDLAFARIYVRAPLEVDVDPKMLMRALNAAKGRLRREVGQAMALRKAPEFRFIYDTGPEAADRVRELLEEIRAEGPIDGGDDEQDADAVNDGSDEAGTAGDGALPDDLAEGDLTEGDLTEDGSADASASVDEAVRGTEPPSSDDDSDTSA